MDENQKISETQIFDNLEEGKEALLSLLAQTSDPDVQRNLRQAIKTIETSESVCVVYIAIMTDGSLEPYLIGGTYEQRLKALAQLRASLAKRFH